MKKLILFALALLFGFQLMAQSELKTKSVSIFKNGKSFVIKEGNVSTNNNIYTLHDIPDALFGTLWFAGKQSKVVQVTSELLKVYESVEYKASNFIDLLYANRGKNCTLTTHDNEIYVGEVEDFNRNEDYKELALLIKTANKWISIKPASIKSIEFATKPSNTFEVTGKINKPLINVKFAKDGNQSLSVMYLQNGLSWAPTYLLELMSDTQANLKLQAEVINHVEDMKNTNIHFVVGVPNFKFEDVASTLTSFVERNYSGRDMAGYKTYSNNMVQMESSSYSEQIMDEDDVHSNINASEDFYFYTVNNVTLEKDIRAQYLLFNSPIGIKHVYECDLSPVEDERKHRKYNNGSQFSFDTKRSNVFHSIEISNNTNSPFTTGSVMIVDGKTQRPLAEDMIKYTGIGQTSSIKLTQSPDIRVEEQEKIINIQENAREQDRYSYNLLTIESEITIVNTKKQDIEMSIQKTISGVSKNSTVKYDSKQMPADNNSDDINPQDRLNFKLNVKSRQTKKFSYTYEMYTR